LAAKATRSDFITPAVQPLVSLPGSANDPAWSPDGTSVAFTWDLGGSETSRVYLLKKSETVPRRLTDSKEPEYRPVWSPDGKQIALLREGQHKQFSIVLIDPVRKIEHVVRRVEWPSFILFLPALDWSSDGKWLVTSEEADDGSQPAHLVLVSPND